MGKPPFQIGLKAAFKATTVAAALMAVFHYVPLEFLGVLLSILAYLLAILFFWMAVFAVFVLWLRTCRWIVKQRQSPDAYQFHPSSPPGVLWIIDTTTGEVKAKNG